MDPRIESVTPLPNFEVELIFVNGEKKRFDVKPYLDKGAFRELQDLQTFQAVKPFLGSIQWENGLDFCPDTLYEESVPITNE